MAIFTTGMLLFTLVPSIALQLVRRVHADAPNTL